MNTWDTSAAFTEEKATAGTKCYQFCLDPAAGTYRRVHLAYGKFAPYFSVTGMLQELSVKKKMELWQADQQPRLTEYSTEV